MRSVQRAGTVALVVLIAAAIYGLVRTSRPENGPQTSGKVARNAPSQPSLVDQSPLKTAQQLAQLADTHEEQALAREALRLGDRELDLGFDIALRDAEAHPVELSAEAKEIEARLQKAKKLQKTLQAQVAQLTAELAKASGDRKEALDDQLNLAKADLDLADNEVEDARQDLGAAGGNQRDRIEQMKKEHEDASHGRAEAEKKFPAPPAEQFGLIHCFQQWFALRQKKLLLTKAKFEAESLAATFVDQHKTLDAQNDAEKFNSPDLIAHSKLADSDAALREATTDAIAQGVRKSRSHEETKAALATAKAITADQQNLASLDKRAANERELADICGQWLELVSAHQRAVVNEGLRGVLIILAIAFLGLSFASWTEKALGRLNLDRRQVQTLVTVTRVSLQVVGVLLVLLVIFGPPGQLGTFLGLAGAGLTVALKDFIVSFLGWFVLMGKNGIRLGDWVEINGVTGEVVELGMFHTVLLETGNWTDSGHPTGRRVTFTNSFAIEGHYFNFSTSGQWLWDELQVVLPPGQDPYPMVDAIQKKVLEATSESASQAEHEWSSATRSRGMSALSAAPAINVKPVIGGIEVSVRYITRASERSQMRARLYQAAVDLLGGIGRAASPDSPQAAPKPV